MSDAREVGGGEGGGGGGRDMGTGEREITTVQTRIVEVHLSIKNAQQKPVARTLTHQVKAALNDQTTNGCGYFIK